MKFLISWSVKLFISPENFFLKEISEVIYIKLLLFNENVNFTQSTLQVLIFILKNFQPLKTKSFSIMKRLLQLQSRSDPSFVNFLNNWRCLPHHRCHVHFLVYVVPYGLRGREPLNRGPGCERGDFLGRGYFGVLLSGHQYFSRAELGVVEGHGWFDRLLVFELQVRVPALCYYFNRLNFLKMYFKL